MARLHHAEPFIRTRMRGAYFRSLGKYRNLLKTKSLLRRIYLLVQQNKKDPQKNHDKHTHAVSGESAFFDALSLARNHKRRRFKISSSVSGKRCVL